MSSKIERQKENKKNEKQREEQEHREKREWYKMGRDSGETWKTNTNQKDNGERETQMWNMYREKSWERENQREKLWEGGTKWGGEGAKKTEREPKRR